MTEETSLTKVESEGSNKAVAVFSTEAGFKVAQRMAKALTLSSLMPEAFRGESGLPNALIAMEIAHRIGASVFMIAQNLDIINGRPSFRSSFLIATINASGKFTPLRFRWQGEEGKDSWGCRAVAKDKETGEECLGTLITVAMAKSEGWYSRKGSKWETLTEQMIAYRAAAFWQRLYAPELALGMHTSEEVNDFEAIPVSVVQKTRTQTVGGIGVSDLESRLLADVPVVTNGAIEGKN